jgi:HSP20 family protein
MAGNSLTGFIQRDLEAPFHSLHREMNRVFDDIFHGRHSSPPQAGSPSQQYGPIMPRIDVSETDKDLRIFADLPGINESDIDVSLVDDILTIRGEKKLEKSDEQENYHLVERSHGTFLRSLRLPYSVDSDKIRAEFDKGVLTVTLPKCKDKERSRKIPVQRGGEHDSTLASEQPKPSKQQGQQSRSPDK